MISVVVDLQINGFPDKPNQAQVRAAIRRGARAGLNEVAALYAKRMREYPPEMPGQRYKRTFKLQGSWAIGRVIEERTLIRKDVISRSSVAPYNAFVQGDDMQAGIHTGRWITDRQALEDIRPTFETIMRRNFTAAISSI